LSYQSQRSIGVASADRVAPFPNCTRYAADTDSLDVGPRDRFLIAGVHRGLL
jgi:hypothetical protein